MKEHLVTAIGAAVLAAAGFAAGTLVPEPPCTDGQQGAARFTYPGKETVALPMSCHSGAWVLPPDAHPVTLDSGGQ